jgi:hypothetical protein
MTKEWVVLGSDAIIFHVNYARKLVDCFLAGKSKDELKALQEQGVLHVLTELRIAVEAHDKDVVVDYP